MAAQFDLKNMSLDQLRLVQALSSEGVVSAVLVVRRLKVAIAGASSPDRLCSDDVLRNLSIGQQAEAGNDLA